MLNRNTRIATADAVYSQHPRVVAAREADHVVLMNSSGRRYYGLDEVGARIWDLLAQPQTTELLAANLSALYDEPIDTLQRDVANFLEVLRTAGLVSARRVR